VLVRFTNRLHDTWFYLITLYKLRTKRATQRMGDSRMSFKYHLYCT